VVFMADCSGLKEVDFREMNELVAATAHDRILHVKRESFAISTAIDGGITSSVRTATAAMKVGRKFQSYFW
jgi:hypothetical protein